MPPTPDTPRLIFLPGLGADARLFDPQRAAFPDLLVPSWIPVRPQETLRDYALRLAETIPRDRPMVLGGVSFGGMLVQEMAAALEPRALILIATALNADEVHPVLRPVGRLIAATPLPLARHARKAGAESSIPFLGPLGPEERRSVFEMAHTAPVELILWGIPAILAWRGSAPPPFPVLRIHGARDRIIPARRVRADHVVAGAGHLANMTHAREINAIISGYLPRLRAGA